MVRCLIIFYSNLHLKEHRLCKKQFLNSFYAIYACCFSNPNAIPLKAAFSRLNRVAYANERNNSSSWNGGKKKHLNDEVG